MSALLLFEGSTECQNLITHKAKYCLSNDNVLKFSYMQTIKQRLSFPAKQFTDCYVLSVLQSWTINSVCGSSGPSIKIIRLQSNNLPKNYWENITHKVQIPFIFSSFLLSTASLHLYSPRGSFVCITIVTIS